MIIIQRILPFQRIRKRMQISKNKYIAHKAYH